MRLVVILGGFGLGFNISLIKEYKEERGGV
jgi:hypothetical protein